MLGQQPYFMNGPGTGPEDAARFREALEAVVPDDVDVESTQVIKL